MRFILKFVFHKVVLLSQTLTANVVKKEPKMKLTQRAIDEIHNSQHKQRILSRLALALDTSEMSIRRYLSGNKDELTKMAALQVIREETGLSEDEILEVATAA